ncbi:helix-turn-helix domain-containing protein [Micromonospora costi]|uniref:helix-turn-helix domain-containing protein n=1 Tax=Micromonospora costi TaxID=1530042 RepID=UPI003409E01A
MHNPTHTPTGGAAAVKAALLASKDLRPNERLVLVAIAAHTNREGQAWPSVATIAEYSGVSPRTVHRVLARLVAVGRLVVSKVSGIASNVYRLVVDAVTNTGPDTANRAPEAANPEVGSATQGVAHEVLEDHSKGKPRAAARESWRRFLPKSKTPNPQQRPP